MTGVSETESRRKIFTCRPTTATEESACAADIVRKLASQAYRGTVPADDFKDLMSFYERGRRLAAVVEGGERRRGLRERHPPRGAGDSRQPALPVPHRADAVDAEGGPDLSRRRSRSGVAAVVLPLGLDAGRRAAEGRVAGHAAHAGGVRPAAEAAAHGSAIGSAVDAVRVAVAAPAGRREGPSRSPLLFVLGHHAVAGDGARDRAVRRQPDSRGSPGHRSADRRPHLRERAAREALRHPEHPRRRVPPRHDCRRRIAAASSGRAASCCSPRSPIAPRRCCAASG